MSSRLSLIMTFIVGLSFGVVIRIVSVLDFHHVSRVVMSSRSLPLPTSTFAETKPWAGANGIKTDIKLTCVLKVTPAEMESLEASLETWVSRCDRHVVICEGNCGNYTDFTVEKSWADWVKLRRTYRYLHSSHKQGNETDALLLTNGSKIYVDVVAVKQYLKAMKLPFNVPFIVSNLMVEKGTVYASSSPVQLINMEALRGMCRRMDYNDGGCKWLSWELGLTTFTKCLADTGAHFIDARDAYNRMLLLPQSLSVLLGTNWSSSSYSSNYLQTVDSGCNCCSEFPLAWITENADEIRSTEFFTQQLGVATNVLPPKRINVTDVTEMPSNTTLQVSSTSTTFQQTAANKTNLRR